MSTGISAPDVHSEEVAARRARVADIERQVGEIAAHIHAATAQLAALSAELDSLDGWCGDGLRSFAHWLTINAGFAPHTGSELLRVGQALRELPRLREAFAAGRLAFDSVRELTRVATAEDESLWLDVAAVASGAQLARICRACRRVLELDSLAHADDQLSRRGLWSHFEDDGMLSLRAVLPPEEGALVMAALEATMRAHRAAEDTADGAAPNAVPNPAELRPAQRADALVALCEHALAADGGALVSDPATLPLLVHVDVGILAGSDPDGRRHLEDGPVLSRATIARLGCDASVIAITERDGIPLDVGRRHRIVPRSLRLAVQSRDRTCRFPACAVPAQRTHAHHLEHWAHEGRTRRDNLVSLCHFHHRRLHDGAYVIRGNPDAALIFETADGRPILRPPREVAPDVGIPGLRAVLPDGDTLDIDAGTPGTRDGTARLDLDDVVDTILDGVTRMRSREHGAA